MPLARSITMADVGLRAGVTARTVSSVLSGSPTVSPRTREKVLQAVDELGYRMNTAARSLRTGRAGTITLAIPDLGIDYFAHLASRVMRHAQKHRWAVVIEQTTDRDTELAILSGARRQPSDGLLFQPHALGPGDERFLVGNDRLVILGDQTFDAAVDHVTMANIHAAAGAVRYLLDRGRKRIAVIGVSPQATAVGAAQLRLDGYRSALLDAGIPIRDDYLIPAQDWHMRDGAVAMNRLLALNDPPDAVFCFNDTLAFGALHVANEAGLRVPEDLSVIGFDNVPHAEFSSPPLTTIEPGTDQIAEYAVDLLAARFDGSSSPAMGLVANFALIARRSA